MLWITERYVDMAKRQTYEIVDWYETKFENDKLRALMRSLCATFGRVRSMWRDAPGGGRRQVGWTFEKRVAYPNTKDTYLREVWVEVSIGDPRQAAPEPLIVSPWIHS